MKEIDALLNETKVKIVKICVDYTNLWDRALAVYYEVQSGCFGIANVNSFKKLIESEQNEPPDYQKKESELTRIRLLKLLESTARDYRKKCYDSIYRNTHMNNLEPNQPWDCQKISNVVDAILVDFINTVAAEQGVDYGLCTKHLKRRKFKSV